MFNKKITGVFLLMSFIPVFAIAQSLNDFETVPDDADANVKRIIVDSIIQNGSVNQMDQINFSNPSSEKGCVQNVGSVTSDNVSGDATATGVVVGDVINICTGF